MGYVFAFDLGKASIGYCVREGFNIKKLESIIIDKDHAETVSNRDRRRVYRTIEAHKAREKFLDNLWINCGLDPLKCDDEKFKKEFANKKDTEIFNSTILRIALLQNLPLKEWQVYKALHSAIQRRGYDANLPWARNSNDENASNEDWKNKDEEENKKSADAYTKNIDGEELIKNNEYKYPAYYDAYRLKLWNENNPKNFKRFIPLRGATKVRDTGIVAPRILVEKELEKLFLNAQSQYPSLKKYSVSYFLYGDYQDSYGSYKKNEFKKFRGRKEDWQGVLGQKIPRFDNRIIEKCKLLPKRNVCKANTIENVSFILLMKLKNLRLTTLSGEKKALTREEIENIYRGWCKKAKNVEIDNDYKLDTTITQREIEKIIAEKVQGKIEPMKANLSGRSSFCRRALQIMIKVILLGVSPTSVDISEFIDDPASSNPITKEEINSMLLKVGSWDNLYIPDNRYEMMEKSSDNREKTDKVIGRLTNPIVRNRLQIFRDLLLKLKKDYGEPDKVIFEFIRDGADSSLLGKKKVDKYIKLVRDREKENNFISEDLKKVNALKGDNFLKLKLLKMQGGYCVYSRRAIGIADLDKCEIDHIYPRTMGGNDALYNKVLCYREQNQDKKGRTPYEWLHGDLKRWNSYLVHLKNNISKLGDRKFSLLVSEPQECKKLIDSWNGLAETAQIARVSQEITAFVFGWGLQVKNEKRRIFVSNGSSTATIRRRYGLNKFLKNDDNKSEDKKNRDNDKHHALDAICISFSQDFKYDKNSDEDKIEGFTPEFVKEAIDKLVPYPYANKKTLKANISPLETVYGLKKFKDKLYITKRIILAELKGKDSLIKNIIDDDIREDLLEKVKTLSKDKWEKLLQNYIHPVKKTKVKKVLTIEKDIYNTDKDSNERTRIEEFVDFGTKGVKNQLKRSKGHKGQILYYDEKGKIRVQPIYANIKIKDIEDKLKNKNCKLYKNGMMFYSGCLINIPNNFKAGKEDKPKGIYKLRSILANGQVYVKNSQGDEALTHITHLIAADFEKHME